VVRGSGKSLRGVGEFDASGQREPGIIVEVLEHDPFKVMPACGKSPPKSGVTSMAGFESGSGSEVTSLAGFAFVVRCGRTRRAHGSRLRHFSDIGLRSRAVRRSTRG
jgi:hypothetical protein